MTTPQRRPSRERFKDLPAPLRHRKSEHGVINIWRDIQNMMVPGPLTIGLPPFVGKLMSAFFDAEPQIVMRAMSTGDVAFFIAFMIRLDQIDTAMVKQRRTDAERAPLIRAKYLVDGFRQAAEKNLVALGGVWPLPT